MASVRSSSGMQMLTLWCLKSEDKAAVRTCVACSPGQRCAALGTYGKSHRGCILYATVLSASTMQQSCAEVRSDDEFQEGHELSCNAPRAVIHCAFQCCFIAL